MSSLTTEKPLWQRTTERIAEEIRHGKFKLGERFYTLDELSRRYGVSNITSRRVIEELDQLGLLERVQAKGAFVRVPPPTEIQFLTTRELTFHALQTTSESSLEMFQGLFGQGERAGVGIVPITLEVLSCEPRRRHLVLVSDYVYDLLAGELAEWLPGEAGNLAVCCFANTPRRGVPTVYVDVRQGALAAMRRLVAQGHRRIAFLTTRVHDAHIFPRFDGYLDGLREADRFLDLDLVGETLRSGESVAQWLARWRALPAPPTAVLVSNYPQAREVLDDARAQGLQVPGDLAVICFDNSRESAVVTPALTVVDLACRRQGEAAVKLLLELAASSSAEPRHVRLEPELVVRQSG